MFPPIFALCAASKSVTDLLGVKPTRLYPFGQAGSDTKKPYAVWQTIGGEPENYLNQAPDIDYLDIQINIYAESASKAREVVKAICKAIELNAYVTRWGGDDRDPETKDYIYTFDVAFITDRDF